MTVTVTTIKPEVVVSAALGILSREVVLPALVWRDAGGDFAGAKNDTISIRLPAYFTARTRELRSGDARTKDSLVERKVDVTLDTDVYADVPITDEELTLDISNFGEQVLNPVLGGVVRALEDELIATMQGATYEREIEFDADDPQATLLRARRLLNDANVPQANRTLAVGSAIEEALLASAQNRDVSQSGSDSALRDAVIDRRAGFTIVSVPGLDPYEAYAFHRTAFVMSSRAPVVPQGAPWGATMSSGGFAIRVVRVFDPNEVEDRLVVDSWVGTNVVLDAGTIGSDGKFVPATSPASDGSDLLFVRAVKITADASS